LPKLSEFNGIRFLSVEIIKPHFLIVDFSDGTHQRINMEPLLRGPVFEPFRDPEYFAQGKFDPDAGTVVWPNEADVAPRYLFEHGEVIHSGAHP
jgi:hypothetical protein